MESAKKVVILGAGFGGVYTAKKLLPLVCSGAIDLTIVNETNYFLFTPLLHEVATGSLSSQSAAESLREIFAGHNVHILQGKIKNIDQTGRTVAIQNTAQPQTDTTVPYDILVVATGATTQYFGNTSAEHNALPLKSLADAERIRRHVIDCFEKAVQMPTEALSYLSFVVVGGGPTGVETVAELSELVYGMAARYHIPRAWQTRVTLVSAGQSILEQFHPNLRKKAEKRLIKKGVHMMLGTSVKDVAANKVVLSNGETIATRSVIWVAGVKAQAPAFAQPLEMNPAGRFPIDEHFRVRGTDTIFALGDVAAPLPMLAQVAVGQSALVAANIKAVIEKKPLSSVHAFIFKSKGSFVSVGQRYAVGEVYGMRVSGMFAWWMWRTIYLSKFLSWSKRFRIMFEWTLALFTPRDITTSEM